MIYLNNDRGNALFVVLVAIILFAALGLAVTRTSNNATTSDQQAANLQADDLLGWASRVKTIVNTLMLTNDTSDISVSFEDPRPGQSGTASAVTNTQNPNSRGTVDEVFNIGDGSGGAAIWRDFSPGTPGLYTTFFNGEHAIDGIGTSAADLAYFIPDIHINLCRAINRRANLGITDADMPSDASLTIKHFKGTYGADTLDNVNGSPFGCVLKTGSPNEYWFYYVIIAR